MSRLCRLLLVTLLALPAAAYAQDDTGEDPGSDSGDEGAEGEADTAEGSEPDGQVPPPPGAAPGSEEPPVSPPPGDESSESPPLAPASAPEPIDLDKPMGALYAQGYARFAGGDFAAAAMYFEEVLRRKPDHPSARNYLVEAYVAAGRDDDATAIRAGGTPGGAPTLPRPAAPEATAQVTNSGAGAPAATKAPAETREQKLDRLNPRRRGFGGLALSLLGPTVGIGIHAEFRPFWLISVSGGLGGLGIDGDATDLELIAVFSDVRLLPIPFRFTPEIGVGLSVVAGPSSWQLDAFGAALYGRRNVRLVPYVILGARYDSPRGFFFSGGVGLIATGRSDRALTAYPGFRFGIRL